MTIRIDRLRLRVAGPPSGARVFARRLAERLTDRLAAAGLAPSESRRVETLALPPLAPRAGETPAALADRTAAAILAAIGRAAE